MLRIRFLIVLALGFLAGTAAWADEVGFVDCSNHSDATQVFGKPRRTPEVLSSLHCGERFTILVYGFYFSRIQTKDGQIGYIYSSLIAVDRGATALPQNPSLQSASEKTKVPSTRALDAKPSAAAPAQTQVASAPVAAAPVQAPGAVFPAPAPVSAAPATAHPAAAPETEAAAAAAAPATNAPEVAAPAAQPEAAAPVAQPEPSA